MRNLFSGDNITLTALKERDFTVIEEWFNNISFLRYYDMIPALPQSYNQVESFVKSFETSNERYLFAIRSNGSGKIIGITGFDEIVWSNGVANVFIGIGDKNFTSKGLGKEAMSLILDFGFNELNFYRIQLNVISYNEAAIKLYESFGFVREGTYRNYIFRDGKRFDMYLYGLLKAEWDKFKNISTIIK